MSQCPSIKVRKEHSHFQVLCEVYFRNDCDKIIRWQRVPLWVFWLDFQNRLGFSWPFNEKEVIIKTVWPITGWSFPCFHLVKAVSYPKLNGKNPLSKPKTYIKSRSKILSTELEKYHILSSITTAATTIMTTITTR